MAHNEKTSKELLSLKELKKMLGAYNKHLIMAEKPLTGPELKKQKAAFMDRMKGILN